MNTVRTLGALSLISLLTLSSATDAQIFPRGNGLSLQGLRQADMYVQISDWQNVSKDAAEFRLTTQQTFEAQLEQAGIRRRTTGRDYLVCAVQALQDRNRISYQARLEYWQRESTGPHRLLWEHSTLSNVPARQFSEQKVASDCADALTTEWLKWNDGVRP